MKFLVFACLLQLSIAMPWFNFRTSSAPTTTTAAPFPKPEFCGKYECPEYETEQLRVS